MIMKNKIMKNILVILVICLFIDLILIIIRYGKNYKNEEDVSSKINIIEKEILNNDINNETIEANYKGYKIEGIIEIPIINIKYPIINKTNNETMKVSITKFSGPKPNEIGNYTVAGHNNFDGTMFGKTKKLKIGDIIKITDLKNNTLEYKIFKIYSIDPNDISCIDSVDPNTKEVTLITCTNGHKNRLITKARENI